MRDLTSFFMRLSFVNGLGNSKEAVETRVGDAKNDAELLVHVGQQFVEVEVVHARIAIVLAAEVGNFEYSLIFKSVKF